MTMTELLLYVVTFFGVIFGGGLYLMIRIWSEKEFEKQKNKMYEDGFKKHQYFKNKFENQIIKHEDVSILNEIINMEDQGCIIRYFGISNLLKNIEKSRDISEKFEIDIRLGSHLFEIGKEIHVYDTIFSRGYFGVEYHGDPTDIYFLIGNKEIKFGDILWESQIVVESEKLKH